ncbi:MAG: MraY family glycosyltransferase [Fimbriimonadales bacterium]
MLFSTFMLAALAALAVALIATPLVKKFAEKFGAMDMPGEERRVHETPTPRWGGLAIYVGVLVAWLAVYPISKVPSGQLAVGPYTVNSIWIVSIGGAIVLFGMLDDKYGLSALWQALFLMACGIALAHPSLGNIRIEGIAMPFADKNSGLHYINFSELNSVLITAVFVFVIAKTMDTIDGIDGLAAGVAAISATTMLILALYNQPLVGVLCAAAVGSCMGFLRYNFHPAKIFMGTGGAQFLGFFLAAVSIQGAMKTAATVAFVVPLLVFGVPIWDAFVVVVRRVLSRSPITQADKRHLHHSLLKKGLNQRQAALILYAVAIVLCGTAILVVKFAA